MAQFSESLCEEVIKSRGKCGLTRNEMVQMAHYALRQIRAENALIRDAARYWMLRDKWKHRIAGMLEHNGPITDEVLDALIDNAMSGAGPAAGTSSVG